MAGDNGVAGHICTLPINGNGNRQRCRQRDKRAYYEAEAFIHKIAKGSSDVDCDCGSDSNCDTCPNLWHPLCGCRCRGRFVSVRLDNNDDDGDDGGSGGLSDLIPRRANTHTHRTHAHTLSHTLMLINILVLFVVVAVSVCE